MFQPGGPTFAELMSQAMSSTLDGYDQLAPKFDLTPFRTPAPVVAAVMTAIGPVDRGIDVCCGTGAGLAALRPLCRVEAVGFDASAGMLAVARAAVPDARFVQGDVRVDSPGEGFDVATCFGAFGHFDGPDVPLLVVRIAAMLRPGGSFVFVTVDPADVPWRAWAIGLGFNAGMRVRNAVWKPEFVMYYLNFLLPRARDCCEAAGLSFEEVGRPAAPFHRYQVVRATKR